MKKNTLLFLLIILVINILFHFEIVTYNIRTAVTLFEYKIFPSLFPFMVISPLLINYGFLDWTKNFFGPIVRRVFHLSENASYILVMGMLSGFPSSAIYSRELYKQNLIAKEDIEKVILFTHFSNPIFILTMVPNHALLVLSTHYILNFIIGIINRSKAHTENVVKSIEAKQTPFFNVFINSIKNSIESLLFILGVIVFFFMITSIIDYPIANIILELSQGINYLNSLSLNAKWQASLTAMLLSFGGLSVHVQTYGILSDIQIPYLPYIKARLLHALLSFIIVYIVL